MAAYKDLVGQKITVVTSNPPEPKTGQMWYNSTDGVLRGLGTIEAISSASPLVYTNFSGGTFGAQTAAVIAGGYSPPTNPPGAGPAMQQTQEYNGNAWSIGGDLNTGRGNQFGFGVETAGVVAAGFTTTNLNAVEEYNGTAFTSVNNIGTGRRGMEGAGPQTAGMVCGGYVGPAGTKSTEEYDGTNWTAGGDLTTSNPINYYNAITGTQTAGLRLAGQSTNVSEEYDGSSWTAGNTMNSPRAYGGSFGAQTAALIAGGSNPPTTYLTAVEKYDGTSFTASPATLSSPRALTGQAAGGISGNTAGIFGGGYSPTDSPTGDYGNTKAEEYNVSTNIITAAAWASGGALPVAVYDGAGAGTQTAGLAFGGDTAPDGTAAGSYEYNGTSWTAGNSLNNGRRELNGFGTQTAGVAALGGDTPATTYTEEYDGTNWSNANAASTARTMMGAAGVQTSGLVCGGNPGTMTTTEEYDGTNWSSGGALPVGKQSNDCFGNIVTAIRNVGGNTSPANYVSTTESYDGTNWTSGPTMLYGADRLAASGSSTSGLVSGGRESGTKTTKCALFDGTTYTTNAVLSNARSGQMATGKGETSNASSFLAGGYNPSNARMTATEEFTGETVAGNVTDFSTE